MTALPDKIYCASVALSTGKEQAQVALRAGKSERDIFIEGNGAENFMACVNAIRGPGTMGLVGGAYILGQTRPTIMEKLRVLRERKITAYDIKTGTFDSAELLSAAIAKINALRGMGKGPKPAVRGRKGGTIKGVRAQEHRTDRISEDILHRLVKCPKLNWKEIADILGPSFSASTLRRHYGHVFYGEKAEMYPRQSWNAKT